jgi:NADPH:quinone reductase-like Zn-dependent oxidoreductase
LALIKQLLIYFSCIYLIYLIYFRWVYPAGYTKSVKGDIVLITGGGSGIGRLMSLKLADLGAIIVTWDVNAKGNEETVR